MMSLTFGLFTQVSGSGPLGPLVVLSFFPRGVLDEILSQFLRSFLPTLAL